MVIQRLAAIFLCLATTVVVSATDFLAVKLEGDYFDGTRFTQPSYEPHVQVELQTSFPNGSIFYTLDGAEPSFASTRYTERFTLTAPGTLRAIAYSVDFSQSIQRSVLLEVVPYYEFWFLESGGTRPTVSPSPPQINPNTFAAEYPQGAEVQLAAQVETGWTFLRWEINGEVDVRNPTTTVMNQNRLVRAVAGTSLNVLPASNGVIETTPAPSELVPFGTDVTVRAIPNDGYYLAQWGGSVSGAAATATFTVRTANPAVSALFLPRPKILLDANFGFKAGQFGFNITGTGNQQVVVERLTEIPGTWLQVGTVQLSNGRCFFSDAQPQGGLAIYRVRQ